MEKLWGVQYFPKTKKFQAPTVWQNRSAVFKKHHQLISVCSLNFLVLATLCKCTAQGGGDLSCGSQRQAGSSDSAAGNSTAKPSPQCIAFTQEKKNLSRHQIQLKGCPWIASEEIWVLTSVTVTPRRGWTTGLFQYLTYITCSLSSLSHSSCQTDLHTCLKHPSLPLCLSSSPPLKNCTSARLRDHPEAAPAEQRPQQRAESILRRAKLGRSMSAQGQDITSPNSSENFKVGKNW